MSKKLIIICVVVFLVFIGFVASSSSTPSQQINSNQTTVKNEERQQENIKITKEIIRLGYRDIASDSARQFDYDSYDKTSLVDISQTIDNYQNGQIIKVPFQTSVEVEVTYEPLELKESGIFGGGSEFLITPDKKVSDYKSTPIQGKVRAWKIASDRAVAHFSPTAHSPYGDGGVTKLELTLETKNGQKINKEWVFQVGKNPKVYDEEF